MRLLKRIKEQADKTDIILDIGDYKIVKQTNLVKIFNNKVAVHTNSTDVSLDKYFKIPL